MKPSFLKVPFAISVLFATAACSFACTCLISPLSKRYKDASAVFVGKIAPNQPSEQSVQNHANGELVFEVLKSWKGVDKKFVAVEFEMPKGAGTCPILYPDETTDYLVFAYGKRLRVSADCPETRSVNKAIGTDADIAQLDKFWFRFWSRARFWR